MAMFVSAGSLIAFAAEAETDLDCADIIASGDCGESAVWELKREDEGTVLHISGTGEIDHFIDPQIPWRDYLTEIEKVRIDYGITKIGTNIFHGCTALTSVDIPESVREIGGGVFIDCEMLRDIEIPESVTAIENFTFSGCKSLEEIELPSGLTRIGSCAFDGCESLKSIEIPDSVTWLGSPDYSDSGFTRSLVFCGCSSLKSVKLPKNLTYIGTSTFVGCKNLTDIQIPGTVTRIEKDAFAGCTKLKKITIPKSVRTIRSNAFNKTVSVCYKGNINQWKSVSVASNAFAKGYTVYYSQKLANTLKVSTKRVTVRYLPLSRKAQIIAAKKVFAVSGAKGKVTYKKISGSRNISVSSAGKLTVRKKLKKGIYTVKVKVSAAGTTAYRAASENVSVRVIVK